jgi:hypothetical protein
LGAPGAPPHDPKRAEGPGKRHGQLEIAELGEQVAAIAAVAPIRLTELGHPLEVLIDRLAHPAFERLDQRLAGAGAIVLALFEAFNLHGLHHPKRGW